MYTCRSCGTFVLTVLALFCANEAFPQADVSDLRTTQPLMENWRFIQTSGLEDEEALTMSGADWEVVNLPHTWNAQDAASYEAESYKRGRAWYRLEFATPSSGVRH